MADDERLASEALRKAKSTCNDALVALTEAILESPQDLAILHKDLVAFLRLLRASTTKLALALKPSSPTYKASLTPLKEISDQVAGLTHCVRLFHPSFGNTLRQEIITTAGDIIQAILPFLEGFLEKETSNGYLARVGTVHDLIDKACVHLPQNNSLAVQKKWAQNQESLEDGMSEVGEILGGGRDDGVDDGWDELGLGDEKITPSEIEQTKTVQTTLRLSVILHRRINADILSSKTPASSAESQDSLLTLSGDLLEASDNVIASLHPKQNPEEIAAELQVFQTVLKSLRTAVLGLFPDSTLESRLESMELSKNSKKTGVEWYTACFQQLDKALERTNLSIKPSSSQQ